MVLGISAAFGFGVVIFVLSMRTDVWGEVPSRRKVSGFGTAVFSAVYFAVLGSLILGPLGGLVGLLVEALEVKSAAKKSDSHQPQ